LEFDPRLALLDVMAFLIPIANCPFVFSFQNWKWKWDQLAH
jgi:hypothetical protein